MQFDTHGDKKGILFHVSEASAHQSSTGNFSDLQE